MLVLTSRDAAAGPDPRGTGRRYSSVYKYLEGTVTKAMASQRLQPSLLL